MIIKIPAADTIYQSKETGVIYLYKGWNKELSGHMMITRNGDYLTYLALCHDEFKSNYYRIGKL